MAAQQNNLWEMCRDGKLVEVSEALQAGADPNTKGGFMDGYLVDSVTCLMVAIWKNHEEVVDLLLAQPGIEVNAKDSRKETALYYACRSGNVVILSKLLAVPGILVNERNCYNHGWTPIMEATFQGKPDVIRVMAAVDKVILDVEQEGCNVHARCIGWTCPLESMVPWEHYEARQEILAILGEARQRKDKRKRLVREQKNRVSKVLLDGIYDEESPLQKLRAPNNAVKDIMPFVWEYLTWDWEVYDENQAVCRIL